MVLSTLAELHRRRSAAQCIKRHILSEDRPTEIGHLGGYGYEGGRVRVSSRNPLSTSQFLKVSETWGPRFGGLSEQALAAPV